tara:strand:+ start:4373 stop:4597 length:225 start_codon:yes stop_codon:yes gene_type:complete
MARVFTYTDVVDKFKQGEIDRVNYILSYIKQTIGGVESPGIVTVGIRGSAIDLRDYLESHPHREPYYIYSNNTL